MIPLAKPFADLWSHLGPFKDHCGVFWAGFVQPVLENLWWYRLHTIGETGVKAAVLKIANIMLGNIAEDKLFQTTFRMTPWTEEKTTWTMIS